MAKSGWVNAIQVGHGSFATYVAPQAWEVRAPLVLRFGVARPVRCGPHTLTRTEVVCMSLATAIRHWEDT